MWQYSVNGTAWNNLSGATNSTYTSVNLIEDTWYRAVVRSGVCNVENSASHKIKVVKYKISGYANYENNPHTPLSGLKITLKKNGTPLGTPVVTTSTGYYEFSGLTNGNYSLEVVSASPGGQWQTWGGVNMTDALIVNNHILGTTLLPVNPPVVMTSASVKLIHPDILNNDYMAIRQAAKSGWGFFDIPKWVFSGTTATPGIDAFTLACADISLDIRGLCAGDVNGTYVPANGVKTTHALSLQVVNEGVVPITNEITFPVRIVGTSHGMSVHGLSVHGTTIPLGAITLYLNYDPSQIEITGVEMPDNGGEEPWFETKDGVLYIGWMSTNPIVVKDEGVMMVVHARLTQEFQVTDANCLLPIAYCQVSNAKCQVSNAKCQIGFALNDNLLSELADEDGNVLSDVKMTIPTGENGKTANWQNGKMEVVSVYPIPAKESLNIELLTESDGPVTLELVSVQGISAMKNPELPLKAGWNREKINVSGLDPGVYMLKVTCGDVTEIRKVIVNR
jgi:hypothetical protein